MNRTRASRDSGPLRLRSVLFTAATAQSRVARIVAAQPDVTVLDLEDAIPDCDKEQARHSAKLITSAIHAAAPEMPVFIRINAAETAWFEDDLTLALSPAVRGVVIPKVEQTSQAEAVRRICRDLPALVLVAGIETALGVDRVQSLLQTGEFDAVYFGAEDFVTDLGGVRRRDNLEVLYARSRVRLAAASARVPAIDQAVLTLDDDAAFEADADEGRSLGYSGKICIHPRQVQLAQRIFTPSAAEVDRASRLLQAYRSAGGDTNGGVAVFEGQMIDTPAANRARDLLALSAAEGPRRRGERSR